MVSSNNDSKIRSRSRKWGTRIYLSFEMLHEFTKNDPSLFMYKALRERGEKKKNAEKKVRPSSERKIRLAFVKGLFDKWNASWSSHQKKPWMAIWKGYRVPKPQVLGTKTITMVINHLRNGMILQVGSGNVT